MMASIKNIDWNDFKVSVPAFLTLAIMPFTYNISYGITFGLISYIVISVFCGDAKKIRGSSWVIALLFVAMLVLTHQAFLPPLHSPANIQAPPDSSGGAIFCFEFT